MDEKRCLQDPLSVEAQIDNLKANNLIIEDEAYAKAVLSRISYFRLIKAYGLGLKPRNGKYNDGITFERIVKIYEFNSKLRALIFPLIEDVEVNLRCKLANCFSLKYGNLGYERSENFQDEEIHSRFFEEYGTEEERGKSLFVANFKNNYEKGKVPFYAAVELFTFGMLSKFYANMKPEEKKAVAKEFGVGYRYLESWIKSITSVRNICAHYGRLYNIKLTIKPDLYKEYPRGCNYRIFGTLLVLKHLVANKSLWLEFQNDITALIDTYGEYIALEAIGFTENWEELLFKNNKR